MSFHPCFSHRQGEHLVACVGPEGPWHAIGLATRTNCRTHEKLGKVAACIVRRRCQWCFSQCFNIMVHIPTYRENQNILISLSKQNTLYRHNMTHTVEECRTSTTTLCMILPQNPQRWLEWKLSEQTSVLPTKMGSFHDLPGSQLFCFNSKDKIAPADTHGRWDGKGA